MRDVVIPTLNEVPLPFNVDVLFLLLRVCVGLLFSVKVEVITRLYPPPPHPVPSLLCFSTPNPYCPLLAEHCVAAYK